MLDQETKRRIDTARDILVGKVPDPKAQVEQITTALIYKFMDDMDKEVEELGGNARFFVGEYAQYAWSKLLDSQLGGQKRLDLYVKALTEMPKNPHLPQLFRDILKDAFLPYRDSETLNLFLKQINGFTYDHSEKLGDAFEYLLSVLGSQGDAGQFRTPRHIIDFIVEVLDPKKDETILDPACGTAGFLISSYKHILKQNTNVRLGDQLTPDEKTKLMNNFMGYDISPDMARLSLVNMYLHGFPSPNVHEYDTLTSEERWDETYDIVMANPPFMSPKGGIRPHKRFSISANRSEILFVDYIAEHLNIHGRAGIIVPEGIIFQSGQAYKALRKMLVDKYLYAVVSLPAGIFQPYSGVKTSILLMDKQLAKKTDNILFVKVENDGFDLGAQRRPIDKSDLPQAAHILKYYRQGLLQGEDVQSISEGILKDANNIVIVEKPVLAKRGDYSLSGERYRVSVRNHKQKWPMVELGDVCEKIMDGTHFSPKNTETGEKLYITAKNIKEDGVDLSNVSYISKVDHDEIYKRCPVKVGDVLYIKDGATAGVATINTINEEFSLLSSVAVLRGKSEKLLNKYLYYYLNSQAGKSDMLSRVGGVAITRLTLAKINEAKIPLPPLEVQKEIVAQLDIYRKIIEGAKQVVENYKPSFKIEPDWEIGSLGNYEIEIIDGDRGTNYPSKEEFSSSGYCLFLNTKNVRENGFNFEICEFITQEKDSILRKGRVQRNDLILTTRGTIGNVAIFDENVPFENIRINSGMVILRPEKSKFLSKFLFYLIQSDYIKQQFKSISSGSAQPQLPIRSLINLEIPVPPLKTQHRIISQIAEEQKLVDANKKLIEIFEQKIEDKISEVWCLESSTEKDEIEASVELEEIKEEEVEKLEIKQAALF